MQLKDILHRTLGLISGGAPFLWGCYGDYTHHIDFESDEGVPCSIVFNRLTNRVFEVSCDKPDGSGAWRWIDPQFRDAHAEEVRRRAIEDATYEYGPQFDEVGTEKEMLDLITLAFEGCQYEDNIININASDETMAQVQAKADERGMTAQEFILETLLDQIKREEVRREKQAF